MRSASEVTIPRDSFVALDMAGIQATRGLKLYSYWQSSCSYRVRIALAYKGVPFEYKAVNLLKEENLTEDFRKLSPLGTVPVLVEDDFILADSFAILEYLEEKYPEPSLFPADLKEKALVRQVVNHVVASIQPLQNMGVLKNIEKKLGSEEKLQWAQHCIEKGFQALEALLKNRAGKYCFGDAFSLADIVLVPQLANAARYHVNMTKFPLLEKIGEAAKALPWVQAAAPNRQPDAAV